MTQQPPRAPLAEKAQAEIPLKHLTGLPHLTIVPKSEETQDTESWEPSDLLVVGVRSASKASRQVAPSTETPKDNFHLDQAVVDAKTHSILSPIIEREKFAGSEGSVLTVHTKASGAPFGDVVCIGLGTQPPRGISILRDIIPANDNVSQKSNGYTSIDSFTGWKLGKALASRISQLKPKSVTFSFKKTDISPAALQCLLEAILVFTSPDDRFKGPKVQNAAARDNLKLDSIVLRVLSTAPMDNSSICASYQQAADQAITIVHGLQLTRQLVNAPPNICTTESLARVAVDIAKRHSLQYKILGEKECSERKMGAYLAVSQGSLYEPQLIHLVHKPASEAKLCLAFVGKGICMDTGGYNLKVGAGIETMKFDMGGAAAVLGAAEIIGRAKPDNVEVHFIIPAAENMISARAYRPGDIITAANGTTIEVGNTDAEGRLTLADGLLYAASEAKPNFLYDCATLTGACMVGLGPTIAGLYGTDAGWTQRVLSCAQESGTTVWPLPLAAEYRPFLDSRLADLNNTSSCRYGGSITAAVFLQEFVPEGLPWCHLDMAGPVWDSSAKEATAFGAKLIAQIILTAAASPTSA